MPNTVDPVQSSLYFAAAATAAKTQEKQKKQTSSISRKFFDLVSENNVEEKSIPETLIEELKGKTDEEAIVYLKDEVDIAGDKLKDSPNPETFVQYKKAIANFLQYTLNKSVQIDLVTGIRRPKTRKQNSYVVIKTIDEKLEKLAAEMLYNHFDKIRLASRIDEITGILVDLMS